MSDIGMKYQNQYKVQRSFFMISIFIENSMMMDLLYMVAFGFLQ